MTIEFIIGVGIGAALLLGFAHSLGQQKNSEGEQKHPILRFFVLMFFLISLNFIPLSMVDDPNYCEVLKVNETTNTTFTTFSYDRVCITNTKNLHTSYYWFITWFIRSFLAVLFVLIFSRFLHFFKELMGARK